MCLFDVWAYVRYLAFLWGALRWAVVGLVWLCLGTAAVAQEGQGRFVPLHVSQDALAAWPSDADWARWAGEAQEQPPRLAYRLEHAGAYYWVWVAPQDLRADDETLRIQPGLVHSVELWFVQPATGLPLEGVSVVAGRMVPVREWTHERAQLVFDVPTVHGERAGVLLRVRMENPIAISLWVGPAKAAYERTLLNLFAYSVAMGALAMLAALTLSVWQAGRYSGHGWLVLSLGAIATLETSTQGYGHFYLWGNAPWWSIRVVSLASAVYLVAYVGFSNGILRSEFVTHPRVRQWSYVLRMVAALLGVWVLVGPFAQAVALLSLFAVFLVLFNAVFSLVVFWSQWRTGLWVVLGHVALLLIFALRMSNLYGISWQGEISPPWLEDFHYMLLWSFLSILIFVSMVRRTVAITANHLQWQKSLIGQMEARIEDRTSELLEAQLEMAELAQKQRVFLATMSHELRTPLSSIAGLAELQRQRSGVEGGLRQDLAVVQRMALHTLSIVDSGLAFVRDEEREFDGPREATEMALSAFCEDVFALGQVLAQAQRNRFSLLAMAGLPRCAWVDEKKLRHVLINLLSNAARYTHGGCVGVRVRAMRGRRGQCLVFLLANSAQGMTTQQMQAYFEPFVKSLESPGLGLGLALVRRMVQDLQGSLQVFCDPHRGAVFRVVVPVALGDDAGAGVWNTAPVCMEQDAAQPADLQRRAFALAPQQAAVARELVQTGQITRLQEWAVALRTEMAANGPALAWLAEWDEALDRLDLPLLESLLGQAAGISANE